VPFSGTSPKTLAFDQPSRRSGGPVGTDSGMLLTMTFHVAVDAGTAPSSHCRWAAPSIVLAGPSASALSLRYCRVSSTKISSRRPQRALRYRRVGSSPAATGQYSRNACRPSGMSGSLGPAKSFLTSWSSQIA
jgi:hypothetical protein